MDGWEVQVLVEEDGVEMIIHNCWQLTEIPIICSSSLVEYFFIVSHIALLIYHDKRSVMQTSQSQGLPLA